MQKKLILPGVGHFTRAMDSLKSNGLFNALNQAVLVMKKPILGICLGMQLMTQFSEEGGVEGFGWLDARVTRFAFEADGLKIPHMGWNRLKLCRESRLLEGIAEEDFFYFVHSYNVSCDREADVLCRTTYGRTFVSAFQRDYIFGCQFHPEKSHDAGLVILKNFSEM